MREMVRCLQRHDVPKVAKKFGKHFQDSLISDDEIMAIHLGGAHAKGLANSESDYDIRIYYKRPLEELVSLRPHGLIFDKKFTQMMNERNGGTFMTWRGFEIEPIFIPVYSISAKKQLLHQLAKQNGDMIYKLFMGIPVTQSDDFTIFMRNLSDRFIWEQYRPKGFFLGYMTSQAMKHHLKLHDDRARDYAKAVRHAEESGSVTPIVKQIMEAVNIGLQGLNFLTTETFYGDFHSLISMENDFFDMEELEFIMQCYNHKTDKLKISTSPEFFVRSERIRAAIFNKLSVALKDVESAMPEKLTDGQNRKNLMLLNESLWSWYDLK